MKICAALISTLLHNQSAQTPLESWVVGFGWIWLGSVVALQLPLPTPTLLPLPLLTEWLARMRGGWVGQLAVGGMLYGCRCNIHNQNSILCHAQLVHPIRPGPGSRSAAGCPLGRQAVIQLVIQPSI